MVKKKERPNTSVGKRRLAIARALVTPGKGNVKINSVPIAIWSNEPLRLWVKEPLSIAGELSNTVDIDVNIKSGGTVGQAEAARMAIAKGLVKYSNDKTLKAKFLEYDRNLLVYDPRRNESHHSSGRGASKRGSRRHKQRSKR